jgi:type I restriction enzyme, S subunit
VTAKRNRGGIIAREVLRGDQIKTKTQFFVEVGDFLISNRQVSHGACGIVPGNLHRAVVSNEYTAFRTSDAIEPAFLNALSHSIYYQQTCFHSSIGVHVEKLVFRLEDWLGWEFDIPPVPEQGRIVAVLGTWDQAINQAECLIIAEEARRKRVLEMLFSGYQIVRTDRKTFRELTLEDVSECFAGGTPERGDKGLYGGGIPWVKSGEVVSSNITETDETITERGLAMSSAKWVPAGSTLIAMYGANAGQVGRLGIDATTNQAILAVIPHTNIVQSDYLYHAIKNAIPSLMRKVQGSGQPNLSAGIVKDEKILVPSESDQKRIAGIASAMETSLEVMKLWRTQVWVQKRGLMQKLLAGDRLLDARFEPQTLPESQLKARAIA